MKTDFIEKWTKCEFVSSSTRTPEFSRFSRDFRKAIDRQLKSIDAEIAAFNIGHFYISGFARKNDRYIYFSISDVRDFKNDWFNHVLFRTARDSQDFRGGQNRYCKLLECGKKFDELFSSDFYWPSSIK